MPLCCLGMLIGQKGRLRRMEEWKGKEICKVWDTLVPSKHGEAGVWLRLKFATSLKK